MRALLPIALLSSAWAQPFGASRLASPNDALTGVAKFDNCTAFAIRPSPETPSGAPAYLITAGHCIDQSVTAVTRDRAVNKTAIFHYFAGATSGQVRVRAPLAVYSTMKGTDLAIVRLDATLADLAGRGIRPFTLAADSPAGGEAVNSAGVPFDSIPPAEQYLRTADCAVGATAELVEGRWHWWQMLRHDCSDIRGGSSGSPLIARRTGEVVGVVTTTNTGAVFTTGDFRCFTNQPCEVIRGGFAYRPETSYAAPVNGLTRCFDSRGEFVLGGACPLDEGRQLTVTSNAVAVQPGAAWNATIAGTAWPMFRYKIVPEGEDDCRNSDGYSAPVAVDNGFRVTNPVGSRPGRQYLCVVGTDGSLSQNPRFATQVHLRVDNTPPTIRPFYLLRDDEGGNFTIQPIFTLPELSRYRYKIVGPGEPGCADPAGYREYLRIPVRVPGRGPERFCLIGHDEAENPTPPTDLPLAGTNLFAGGVVNAASFGAVAPGSLVTFYGTGLANGGGLSVIDGGGNVHLLEVLYRDGVQINARLPLEAVPGRATARLENARAPFEIASAAPALFGRFGTGGGEGVYELQGLDVLWLAGTGFNRERNAEIRISGIPLAATVVPFEGIDWLRVDLPPGFRLRGLVPVQVRLNQSFSNTVWVRITERP